MLMMYCRVFAWYFIQGLFDLLRYVIQFEFNVLIVDMET